MSESTTLDKVGSEGELQQVEDENGIWYSVGQNNGKAKIFSKDGQQISKSCHVCQAQHINWKCGKGCRASYCSRCLEYCGLTVMDAITNGCARCNETCICKKCLRLMERQEVTTVPPQQRLAALLRGQPSRKLSASGSSGHYDNKKLGGTNGQMADSSTVGNRKPTRIRKRERPPSTDESDLEYAQVLLGVHGAEDKKPEIDLEKDGSTRNDCRTNPTPVHLTMNADPEQVEDDTVIAQGSDVYSLGQHMGKKRVFDATGEIQISKSCHQCQDQHIAVVCKSGKEGCKASYCRRCCEKYYQGMTYEEIMEKCPRCRGFCNCRGCLRVEWEPLKPSVSKDESPIFAEHILNCTGGYIKDVLADYDKEAAVDNVKLEDVRTEPPNSRRINCDRCSTSIPDLHRACETCGIDLCVYCCEEVRGLFGKVMCPMCSNPIELKKQLSGDMLWDLRQIAKDYGECKVTASGPSWSRKHLGTEVNGGNVSSLQRYCQGHWSERVDKSMVRKACNHPDAPRRYVFCPSNDDLKDDDNLQIFQECLRRGEPVIVRGIKGVMDWRPETMCRAVVEKGNKSFGVGAKNADVTVISCTDQWGEFPMSQKTFFNVYKEPAYNAMLKIKDWPPEEHFKDRLKRHNQDFLEMLPFHEYTNPFWGPLNMYRALPHKCLPPDLGPKTYVALGRQEEHKREGDSVTKLHVDMSDAINVLVDTSVSEEERAAAHIRSGDEEWSLPSYGNAGAVWDIVPRENAKMVDEYLRFRQGKFIHNGKLVTKHGVKDPILEQMFYLHSEDRDSLEKDYGVYLWHFEQHANEAIFIPSGAPHQVRNLRSCIKVAIDLVPPESCGEILKLSEKLRTLARSDRDAGLDKLQGVATMMYAAREAYRIKAGEVDCFATKTVSTKRKAIKSKKKSRHDGTDEDDP